jgi:hypothetical protein
MGASECIEDGLSRAVKGLAKRAQAKDAPGRDYSDYNLDILSPYEQDTTA